MQLAIYAHPFDLDALRSIGGLARLRDLGFTEIAMATSYHDGRWLQPWHPNGRVRFLEDGTVHFRPRGDYGVLQPKTSSEVPAAAGPSPLERLCREAPPLGLAVRAWNVFTHNTRLGTLHPELCVQNAFGDPYTYALCPSQPAVQQYIVAMTKDLAAHAGLGSIEFEALGQMGWKHSSHHDKASFVPTPLLDAALSVCFCSRCTATFANAAAHRAAVAAFVDERVRDADAMTPAAVADPAPPPWLADALAVRAASVGRIAAMVVSAARTTRAVQVHPSPWFTGSQLAVASTVAFPVGDERVLTCYGEAPDVIGKQLASLPDAARPSPRRVSIWPKAPQFKSDEDVVKLRDVLVREDVGAVAIYHLGLLPWRTIERVAKILRA